jgi:hypothetical protein
MNITDSEKDKLLNDVSRIADALEAFVGKPAWVKVAEERLAASSAALENAIGEEQAEEPKELESSDVQSITENLTTEVESLNSSEPTEPSKKEFLKDAARQERIPENEPISFSAAVPGAKIRVGGTGKNPNKLGTIVKRSKAWVTITLDDGTTVSERPKDVYAHVEGKDSPPAEVVVTEVTEEVGSDYVPNDNPADPANQAFSSGIHKGKSIHVVYSAGPKGVAFVKWTARKHTDEVMRTAAAAYLSDIGEAE